MCIDMLCPQLNVISSLCLYEQKELLQVINVEL
jgi:hypothetical protein